jgi:lipoate-protein ligase A
MSLEIKRLELPKNKTLTEQVAIDEALLELAESTDEFPELIRIWEPSSPLVVIGRSSPIEIEVNLEYCSQHQIPVLRRCSGGQSIVTGPDCLMYAVLLDYRKRPQLRMLERAHEFVMTQMQAAIESIGVETTMQGTSDLTFNGKKFSGNALRCKKNWLVYHGTMLCGFDLETIFSCLRDPIRQPDYRAGRSHQEFLTNLPTTAEALGPAIVQQWQANQPVTIPLDSVQELVTNKYETREWTYKV